MNRYLFFGVPCTGFVHHFRNFSGPQVHTYLKHVTRSHTHNREIGVSTTIPAPQALVWGTSALNPTLIAK
tara:strand:- start:1332 stop:1541 length:210 start_codon:yes stop_codon:yes gene_type:complete